MNAPTGAGRRKALAAGGVVGALAAISEAKGVYTGAKEYYSQWQAKQNYTVELSSNDSLYPDACAWIDELLVRDKRRALIVRSDRAGSENGVSVPDNGSRTRVKRQLTTTSNTERGSKIVVNGHEVRVILHRPDSEKSEASNWTFKPETLLFTCRSQEGQDAVLAALNDLLAAREKADRRPTLRILETKWGSWRHRDDLPPRPLESVVLRSGQLERIVCDLKRFLASEDEYVRRALPWHRGFLLEGPPGTGKTSLARALASHFGLDLWYAPLGDVKDDSALLSLLGEVHPRSMVLLEDVDVFAASHEREAENTKHVTLSGLLNALDGVATPHGLITVMTTNKPKELDEALTRAGRMDVVETLELPDSEQIRRLFTFFYGEAPPGHIIGDGRSTAEFLEIFKNNMGSPFLGWQACQKA